MVKHVTAETLRKLFATQSGKTRLLSQEDSDIAEIHNQNEAVDDPATRKWSRVPHPSNPRMRRILSLQGRPVKFQPSIHDGPYTFKNYSHWKAQNKRMGDVSAFNFKNGVKIKDIAFGKKGDVSIVDSYNGIIAFEEITPRNEAQPLKLIKSRCLAIKGV